MEQDKKDRILCDDCIGKSCRIHHCFGRNTHRFNSIACSRFYPKPKCFHDFLVYLYKYVKYSIYGMLYRIKYNIRMFLFTHQPNKIPSFLKPGDRIRFIYNSELEKIDQRCIDYYKKVLEKSEVETVVRAYVFYSHHEKRCYLGIMTDKSSLAFNAFEATYGKNGCKTLLDINGKRHFQYNTYYNKWTI